MSYRPVFHSSGRVQWAETIYIIDSRLQHLQVVAHGSYHSDEGIQLEKFSLEAGEAHCPREANAILALRGLTQKQRA